MPRVRLHIVFRCCGRVAQLVARKPVPGVHTAPYCHACTAFIYRNMFLHWRRERLDMYRVLHEALQLAVRACGCVLGLLGVAWMVRRGHVSTNHPVLASFLEFVAPLLLTYCVSRH